MLLRERTLSCLLALHDGDSNWKLEMGASYKYVAQQEVPVFFLLSLWWSHNSDTFLSKHG